MDDDNDGYMWDVGFLFSLSIYRLTAVRLPATKRGKPLQYYLYFFLSFTPHPVECYKTIFTDFQ
jgi:hypothetical protein